MTRRVGNHTHIAEDMERDRERHLATPRPDIEGSWYTTEFNEDDDDGDQWRNVSRLHHNPYAR